MTHPSRAIVFCRLAVFTCFFSLFISPLSAYEKGDLLLRVGVITVSPNDDSSVITHSVLGAVANSSAGVDDDTQLGITGTYMFSSHIGLELLAATPFEHDITTVGIGVPVAGSTKHLPPTLCLQYYPLKKESRFQPYLGVGLNYTTFFSEKPTAAMTTALGFTELELDDSFGIAAQVGFDVLVKKHWLFNVGIWYADIDTTATFSGGGNSAAVDVEIDPVVFNIGLGYKF
jgi:outer membrane protein